MRPKLIAVTDIATIAISRVAPCAREKEPGLHQKGALRRSAR